MFRAPALFAAILAIATFAADKPAPKQEPAPVFGATLSEKMNFSEYDKINDLALNYVLWHEVMGRDAPQPPAVRRAVAFRAIREEKDKK